jgi:hypothetical protein
MLQDFLEPESFQMMYFILEYRVIRDGIPVSTHNQNSIPWHYQLKNSKQTVSDISKQ